MIRIALLLSFISAASFAATYSVVPVQVPSGFTAVTMTDINNSGQVAGWQPLNLYPLRTLPFIGSPSGGAAIPLPAGFTNAYATSINISGQVACYGSNGSGSQAFIGTLSGSALIPFPAGLSLATANSINDAGQVTGSVGPNFNQAYIGTIAGSTLIPLPSGWTNAIGYSVNASGQVAGTVFSLSTNQAFVGTITQSAVVPLPSGWQNANGLAIDASGQVAGNGLDGSNNTRVFIGTISGTSAIPPPVGANGYVTMGSGSLNNSGVIVGVSSVGGWIWDPTNGTRLLNSLVPSSWNVNDAASISNNGLILAQASYSSGASSNTGAFDGQSSPDRCGALFNVVGWKSPHISQDFKHG